MIEKIFEKYEFGAANVSIQAMLTLYAQVYNLYIHLLVYRYIDSYALVTFMCYIHVTIHVLYYNDFTMHTHACLNGYQYYLTYICISSLYLTRAC